jgi:hypothetical protein
MIQGSIGEGSMRVKGSRGNLLFLALFVSLSIVALSSVTPVYAKGGGGGSPYSCAVAVTVGSGNFYVKTTVNAANGSTLPGPSETDDLNSYQNGILYNTQSVKYTVSSGTVSTTVTVPVPSNGAGTYSFQSTILNSKGNQITSCSGTYSL